MDRSRGKKDYPKSATSRFETEYSRSYSKQNTSRESQSTYHHSAYANLSSPTNSNSVLRVTKPQTPYPSQSARNCYRSSTAVPSSFHTLSKINKMEQILKKSAGIAPNGDSPQRNSSREASARSSAPSSGKMNSYNGHMSQMYGTTRDRGSETTSPFDDSSSKMRGGDHPWTSNLPTGYDKIKEESPTKHCLTKEDIRTKGQGDNARSSSRGTKTSILSKSKAKSLTSRWARPASKTNKKKVRFCDNITTYPVPYEERGSMEWRKNIASLNMGYMGFPNLRYMTMPTKDFTYNLPVLPGSGSRPSSSYDQSMIMPLMMPSQNSRLLDNNWNNGVNRNSSLCGSYPAESDLARYFERELTLKTPKPKSPYEKAIYDYAASRRR